MDHHYFRVFALNARSNVLVFKEFITPSLLVIPFTLFLSKIDKNIFIGWDICTFSAKFNVIKILQTSNSLRNKRGMLIKNYLERE